MTRVEGLHIIRVHRQHSSTVMVIPIAIRKALGIQAGDYLVLSSNQRTGIVEMTKFIRKGKQNGRGKRNSGRKNQRGRTRS